MFSHRNNSRNAARTALVLAAAAALAGCASSSKTTLGAADRMSDTPAMGVGDALGSAMFGEHVRLAALEARQRRAMIRDYATVQAPTD